MCLEKYVDLHNVNIAFPNLTYLVNKEEQKRDENGNRPPRPSEANDKQNSHHYTKIIVSKGSIFCHEVNRVGNDCMVTIGVSCYSLHIGLPTQNHVPDSDVSAFLLSTI